MHSITNNNFIRYPPPAHRDLPADRRQFNQTSVFEPCSEPHTSSSPTTIAAGCPSELQRPATQNAPTPSSIQTFPPDANALPRKRAAYNNRPHTGSFQAQRNSTATIPASRLSQIPGSQRYSQRSSNLTKRSHDSVGLMSVPSPNLPQTTAIKCLSKLVPTTQLAAPSQNQPEKQARQTQSTPPQTTKKRRSQTESQQHLPLTQHLVPST